MWVIKGPLKNLIDQCFWFSKYALSKASGISKDQQLEKGSYQTIFFFNQTIIFQSNNYFIINGTNQYIFM